MICSEQILCLILNLNYIIGQYSMINKVDYTHLQLQKYITTAQAIVYSALMASSDHSSVYELHLKYKHHTRPMALKVYGEHCRLPNNLSLLLNSNLKHIVKILDYKQEMPAYVSMQLCKQDLKELIIRQGHSLSGQSKLRYIQEIAEGLLSLKLLKLMHGDIKPQNILIDQNNSIKVGDIDFVVREDEFQNTRIRMGTLPYMAPEVMNDWACSYASDIWSLGVVIYEMYFGQTPFAEIQNLDSRKQNSINHSYLIIKQRLDHIRNHLKNCIKQSIDNISTLILQAMLKCLVWNVSDRGQIQEIIALLEGGKMRRKLSESTDYTSLHYQDDLFILPNTSLLLAFQKLNSILSYLPQEANKFKDVQQKIQEIHTNPSKANTTIKAIKQIIELKYQKMNRVFQRLSKVEGGIDYSPKGELYQHLAYLINLLEQEVGSQQWIKQNSVKSAEL